MNTEEIELGKIYYRKFKLTGGTIYVVPTIVSNMIVNIVIIHNGSQKLIAKTLFQKLWTKLDASSKTWKDL